LSHRGTDEQERDRRQRILPPIPIEGVTDIAVWHRNDLRTADNAALSAAVRDGRPAPVFVVDPRFYGDRGLACDARLQFYHESLADLREQYRHLGSDLALLSGDARERLADLLAAVDRVYVNRDATARYGHERDAAVLWWDRVEAFADDGLRWPDERDADGTVAVDTRDAIDGDDWSDHCEAYFERDPRERPESLPPNPIESDVTIADIERRYDVDPSKTDVPAGGTMAGTERLSSFVDRVHEYPAVVSPPAAAEERSSRLSAYLAVGALSVRQVYRRVRDAPSSRGRSLFTSRLYWNRHYTQKLADWPGWTDRAVNPVFRGLFREAHDPDLVAAWKRGETGFPLVDAAMRALVETGYINFRMRAMVASFFVYVLREWWKRGADFMYHHLIDADAAINYTQWQSQAN
jgi:deoxyribodipyrimidine photo-lyase